MKLTSLIALWVFLTIAATNSTSAFAADSDGVAVAIVYDTSGSMREEVSDSTGKLSPKYVVANRALAGIARRIQTFVTNNAAGTTRNIQAGLFVFGGNGTRQAVKFGPFDAAALENWARSFSAPAGGTPLGTALTDAGRTVLNSGLIRKHVLIITDGNNTVGPAPAETMPRLKAQAEAKQTGVSVHFVAFDVDAGVFAPVKKLGATVMAAADENQLNQQLEFILSKKILLEEEEPPQEK